MIIITVVGSIGSDAEEHGNAPGNSNETVAQS